MVKINYYHVDFCFVFFSLLLKNKFRENLRNEFMYMNLNKKKQNRFFYLIYILKPESTHETMNNKKMRIN